ncbi:MAG: hypothetical protein FJX22_01170 [Alphaproteobacteria bacterium]|nr:hypothetical protein [Alphaproteobacteria bacterium]
MPGQEAGKKGGKHQGHGAAHGAAHGSAHGSGQGSVGRRGCEHPDCAAAGEYPAPRSRHQLRQYRWFCLEHIKSYNNKWNYFEGLGDQLLEEHRKADMTWRRPTWRPGQSLRGWHDPERRLLDEIGLTEFAPQFFQAAQGRNHRAGNQAQQDSGQAKGDNGGHNGRYAGGYSSGLGREALSAADAATMAKLRAIAPPRHLRSALTLFDLPYPFSAQQLKQRYRQLVKQHHPDALAAMGHAPAAPLSPLSSSATNTGTNAAPNTATSRPKAHSASDDAMKTINDAHQRLKSHLQGGDG